MQIVIRKLENSCWYIYCSVILSAIWKNHLHAQLSSAVETWWNPYRMYTWEILFVYV
jgi:hypothetical protein